MSELISNIVYAVLIVVIPILTKAFVDYITAKIDSISQNKESVKFEQTKKDALKLIADTVSQVSQTYVLTLKEEGKFDEEAQKKAFKMAYTNVQELLSEESKQLLIDAYGDLSKWITTEIESQVLKQKVAG